MAECPLLLCVHMAFGIYCAAGERCCALTLGLSLTPLSPLPWGARMPPPCPHPHPGADTGGRMVAQHLAVPLGLVTVMVKDML